MEIKNIEMVVTMDELSDIENAAAKIHETIGIKQWCENYNKNRYLIVIPANLFVTFVAQKLYNLPVSTDSEEKGVENEQRKGKSDNCYNYTNT